MSEEILIGLVAIIFLGVTAQWIGWRLKIPSILLLLVFGFLAGPIFDFVEPGLIFGNLLYPLVSFSVAVILFDGGLTLRFSEISGVKKTVWSIVTVGALIHGTLIGLAAFYLLKFSIGMSILFGAMLIVTGPTVIIPLLRHMKIRGATGPVLRWEGIYTDPLGAILSVLVFEALLIQDFQQAWFVVFSGILNTIFWGSLIAIAGAAIIILLVKKFWTPDLLQNPITFMMVLCVYVASNHFQPESGLFAVTVMGTIIANQKLVNVEKIIEFKENIGVLLTSMLFIILAANLDIDELLSLGANSFYFILFMIFVARPVSVFASTFLSELRFKEKIFLSLMAPRGIIAAAVASIFAIKLKEKGFPEAGQLVSVTFLVIVITVTFYGTLSIPLARLLGLSDKKSQGMLIIGAVKWAREIAKALEKNGIFVILLDTNKANISYARRTGLTAIHANALSEYVLEDLNLDTISNVIALTPNDEVNALACLQFSKLLGSSNIYQLAPEVLEVDEKKNVVQKDLRGRILFDKMASSVFIEKCFSQGGAIFTNELKEEFGYKELLQEHPEGILPLFVVGSDKSLTILSDKNNQKFQNGQKLVYLTLSARSPA